LDGNLRINLADEGYLWYGTRSVIAGQVPMRDFHGYDPGRYFWTVAWSWVLGDSLVALRLACVLFQCLGVLAGLLAARRLSPHPLFLATVAVAFCAWMHPRYKVFEQSIALMAVYAAVLLIERPTLRRQFGVGVFGGLAAFMGRNHGAYHLVTFGLLLILVARNESIEQWIRRSVAWFGGMLVGYLPQWVMFLAVPGYFRQFLVNLGDIFSKGTNLPTKVPWPWLVPSEYTSWHRYSSIAEGCYYAAFPALFLLFGVAAWKLRRASLAMPALLVAAVGVTLPYTHYVFSRADIVHLSHGAPLLALGFLALAFTMPGRVRWVGISVAPLVAVSSLLANLFQYGIALEWFSPPRSLFALDVAGERMIAPRYHAQIIQSAHTLARELATADEPIFFAPHMPGLYAITRRFSPTKQIYFIFAATPEEDRALLAEIESAGVKWAMLHDYPLDGRDDLRFRNTYPRVFAFLQEHFDPVTLPSLPPDMTIFHRRPAGADAARVSAAAR
jgi:hypothetical protein